MDKDNNLARSSLESIVIGGRKLGIDVSKYESDLAKLKSESNTETVEAKKEPQKSIKGEPIPTVVYDKTIKPSELFGTPIPTTPAIQPAIASSITVDEKIETIMLNKLANTSWRDSGLELLFDGAIEPSRVKLSKILEPQISRYRYIVDVDSAMLNRAHNIEHKDISRIKIAQYDAKTVRVVFEHDKPLNIKPAVENRAIYIDLSVDTSKQPAEAQIKATPPKKEQPTSLDLPPLVALQPKTPTKKIVVIDPGHGGKDSGAVGNGFYEKHIVLQISKKLTQKLTSLGYGVHMTRNDDRFIELKDRTKFANDKNADLFISVHANAIPKTSDPNKAQGIETYFLSPTRSERSMRVAAMENSEDMNEMGQYGKLSFLSFLNKEKIIASNKLAIDLQRGMVNTTRKGFSSVVDNGVREGPFWVLVGAQMPAVLLEVGYITHPTESKRIADEKYQNHLVDGLADGVVRYFQNN